MTEPMTAEPLTATDDLLSQLRERLSQVDAGLAIVRSRLNQLIECRFGLEHAIAAEERLLAIGPVGLDDATPPESKIPIEDERSET